MFYYYYPRSSNSVIPVLLFLLLHVLYTKYMYISVCVIIVVVCYTIVQLSECPCTTTSMTHIFFCNSQNTCIMQKVIKSDNITCNPSLVPRPRRGKGESGLVTNVCACAEITKKTGNRILSVNSSYYGTVYVHL